MKTARYSKIALVALLSIGIAQGTALAKQKKDDDTSVYNWGPWGKMVTPAAGPTVPLTVQLPTGFTFQDIDIIIPEDEPDPDPLYRSYAIQYEGVYNVGDGSYWYGPLPPAPAVFEGGMTLDGAAPPVGDVTSAWFTSNVPLSGQYPGTDYSNYAAQSSGNMTGTYTEDGSGNIFAYAYNANHEIHINRAPWLTDVEYGEWHSYDGGEGATAGDFVRGATPTLAFMDSLAGSQEAIYIGDSPFGNNVTLTMHIGGTPTWTGVWGNNGADGSVAFGNANGEQFVVGQVGFIANGTISGVDFSSSSLGTTTPGASVTGSVNGSFFGSQAEKVGGIVNITKTYPWVEGQNPDQSYHHVDLFQATKTSSLPN